MKGRTQGDNSWMSNPNPSGLQEFLLLKSSSDPNVQEKNYHGCYALDLSKIV
jgi:hypothetical protein